MWLIAIIGGATAFIESTLGQLYKVRGKDSYIGGPAYYIRDGLGWKPLAVAFAVIITVTYGFVFNAVQANSISESIRNQFSLEGAGSSLIIGVVLAVVTGLVIFGGVRRLSAVTEILVPVMAAAYIVVAVVVVIINITEVPDMVALIVGQALGFREVAGATIGAAIMQGMRRGLFSNEAGMGSTPHAHALARVDKPQDQGLAAMIGVFIDTFIVLTMTALVILSSGLLQPLQEGGLTGTALAQAAFNQAFGSFGNAFVAVCMLFFAFSTIIGWYFFGETNVKALLGPKAVRPYAVIAVLCIVVGSVQKVDLVWNMSDMFNGLMVIPNLLGVLALSGVVAKLARGGKAEADEAQKEAAARAAAAEQD